MRRALATVAAVCQSVEPFTRSHECLRCPRCGDRYYPQTANGYVIDFCIHCGDITRLVAAAAVAPSPLRQHRYPSERAAPNSGDVPESVYHARCACGRFKTIRAGKRSPRQCDACNPLAARRRGYEASRRDQLPASRGRAS